MAEQEKQGQNQPAADETGGTRENVSQDNESGQAKQEQSNSSSADTEQTGEGTGAKAGEYS